MNAPSASLFVMSCMNCRNSRGPNCCEASDIATTMIEKTTPPTVIEEAAIALSRARAASGPPPNS